MPTMSSTTLVVCESVEKTNPYEELAPEKSIPGFLRVIFLVLVDEQGPLVTGNKYVATLQLGTYPRDNVTVTEAQKK